MRCASIHAHSQVESCLCDSSYVAELGNFWTGTVKKMPLFRMHEVVIAVNSW